MYLVRNLKLLNEAKVHKHADGNSASIQQAQVVIVEFVAVKWKQVKGMESEGCA